MAGHPVRNIKDQRHMARWRLVAYGAMLLLALLALTEIAAA